MNAPGRSSFVVALAALAPACLVIGAPPAAAQVERDRAVFAAISLGPGDTAIFNERRLRWKNWLVQRYNTGNFWAVCSQASEHPASAAFDYAGPPARIISQWCHGNPRQIALFVFEGEAQAKALAASQGINPNGYSWRHVGGPYAIRIRYGAPGPVVGGLLDAMTAEIQASINLSQPAHPPGSASVSSPPAPPESDQPPPDPSDLPIDDIADAVPEFTPAEIAAVAGVAGGAALLGSLMLLGASGVRREEVLESIRELLRGRLPEDPFEAWKRKYEALGWKYSQKNGIATFNPVDGARNEAGEVFSIATGRFETAGGLATHAPAPPHDGDVNERGEVWSENDRAFVQRAYYDRERARLRDLEERRAGEIAEAERISRAEADAIAEENARRAQEIADSRAARAAAQAAEAATRERIAEKLRRAGAEPGEIERLSAAGDTVGLKQLYAEHLHRVMDAATAEAQAQKRWADVMAAGEYASKATLAAAKTGMMVVGGPAGMVAVATGVGTISSVEEGARAFVNGKTPAEVAGAFATGFLSGAKDGAVGRYVNMARISATTKVALPAALDAAEAYARTGDVRTALTAGVLSSVGGAAGLKLGGISSAVGREGAQTLLGGVMGAAGRAATDGNVTEGFVDGLVGSIGSTAGGRIANAQAPMTKADIQMDIEAKANAAHGKGLVEDLKRAIASGTPEEQKAAVSRVLENRDAKLLLKGEAIDDATKTAFADLADQHRTQPVFKGTADHLNAQTVTKDGATTSRFVVREPDPANPGKFVERAVRPDDFKSTSGSAGKAPGMDLDMTATATIIDKQSGRPARPAELESAVGAACNKLGISKSGQEINVMHRTHAEAYTLRPGEEPSGFIPRVRSGDVTGSEGRSLSEVTAVKLAEANVLHKGNTGAGAVAENCRTAIKDFDRITSPLIEKSPGARLPPVFQARDAVTGDTPMDIMRAVANGQMPPGTGNARFRALTGMSLNQGAEKLAQMPEFVAKFGATSPAGAPLEPPPLIYKPGAAPRDVATEALRQALRIGTDNDGAASPSAAL